MYYTNACQRDNLHLGKKQRTDDVQYLLKDFPSQMIPPIVECVTRKKSIWFCSERYENIDGNAYGLSLSYVINVIVAYLPSHSFS